jgi:hypothetical protein
MIDLVLLYRFFKIRTTRTVAEEVKPAISQSPNKNETLY